MIHGASMVLKELPVILSHEGREPFPHVPRSAKQAASPTPACPLLRKWYPGKAGASDRPGSFFSVGETPALQIVQRFKPPRRKDAKATKKTVGTHLRARRAAGSRAYGAQFIFSAMSVPL